MRIELRGIELHGYHGALESEREQGQRFLFDVELDVGEAGSSDRLEDAVDYRDVVACVRDVSDGRAYQLLEALATALADELLARFPVERVSVRVRKPDVVLDPPVEYAAVTRDAAVTVAYVGVGSNLGDREATIRAAIAALPGVVAVSTLRETDPVGVVDQPRFLNGAVRLETDLSARQLLDALLAIERELGRERRERWGPRTIDLDLLLYGDTTVDEPGLTVPHPRLHERRFVLEPLAELDPALVIPGRGRVSDLLAELD